MGASPGQARWQLIDHDLRDRLDRCARLLDLAIRDGRDTEQRQECLRQREWSLLFVSQCINGHLTRTPLFDSSLQNYFWSYDNNGLKLLQLRFYQLPTTVAASGTVC